MKIIEWCNVNQGFISAILSALTLVFSVIAIVVSINTAKLPFKKRLKLVAGHEMSPLGLGLHITAINTGNRPITISMIGFEINGKQVIIPEQIGNSQITLQPTEITTQHYREESLIPAISSAEFPKEENVYAYVKDTEGDMHKKKIGQVSDITG